MEALVIIVLEYLTMLLWPVLAMCGAVLTVFAELVFEVFRGLFRRKAKRRSPVETAERPSTIPSEQKATAPVLMSASMRRRLVGLVGVPVALIAAPLIIANLFFFEPIARWATERIAAKTDMTIVYDDIDGNLFAGRLELEGLKVIRQTGQGPEFDIAVRNASVDANLWTIFSRERHIEELDVEGVSGQITVTATDATPEDKTKKRAFAVSDLRIRDVAIQIAPPNRDPVSLEISSATSPLFRSRYAAFDLFFRSNLDARIDDVPLTVTTTALSDRSRSTVWRLDNAPVEPIGDLVGRPPATWFQDGTVSVAVDDFWDLDDLTIDMDWRLYLDNARIAAPDGAGLRERALAGALNSWIKRQTDGVELAFELYMDDDTFRANGSRDLTGLWNAMLPAIRKALASKGIEVGQDTPAEAEAEAEAEEVNDKPTLGERAKSVAGRVGTLFKRDADE